jgi:hypothetical protein
MRVSFAHVIPSDPDGSDVRFKRCLSSLEL